MGINTIHNEHDYQATLREVSAYFDNEPAPTTPDGDRFQALLALVEAYEAKHYPIAPPAQPKNPLHGITLEAIVTALVAHFGWDELAQRIPVNCFTHDPSIKSSLKFLRKTPWARDKVESLYSFMLRDIKRADSA